MRWFSIYTLGMSFPHFLWTWLVVKWVKFLFNQGPDPSLVYRPDVDPEMAKSKDSFRNYTVSDTLGLLCLFKQVSGPALWRADLPLLPEALKGIFLFFWKPHSCGIYGLQQGRPWSPVCWGSSQAPSLH